MTELYCLQKKGYWLVLRGGKGIHGGENLLLDPLSPLIRYDLERVLLCVTQLTSGTLTEWSIATLVSGLYPDGAIWLERFSGRGRFCSVLNLHVIPYSVEMLTPRGMLK